MNDHNDCSRNENDTKAVDISKQGWEAKQLLSSARREMLERPIAAVACILGILGAILSGLFALMVTISNALSNLSYWVTIPIAVAFPIVAIWNAFQIEVRFNKSKPVSSRSLQMLGASALLLPSLTVFFIIIEVLYIILAKIIEPSSNGSSLFVVSNQDMLERARVFVKVASIASLLATTVVVGVCVAKVMSVVIGFRELLGILSSQGKQNDA